MFTSLATWVWVIKINAFISRNEINWAALYSSLYKGSKIYFVLGSLGTKQFSLRGYFGLHRQRVGTWGERNRPSSLYCVTIVVEDETQSMLSCSSSLGLKSRCTRHHPFTYEIVLSSVLEDKKTKKLENFGRSCITFSVKVNWKLRSASSVSKLLLLWHYTCYASFAHR